MIQGLLSCRYKSPNVLITDCVSISTPFQINQITLVSSMWEARSASSHLRLVTWLHKCSSSVPLYSSVGKSILTTGLMSSMYSNTGLGWSWQPWLLTWHILGETSASVCLLQRREVQKLATLKPDGMWVLSLPLVSVKRWTNQLKVIVFWTETERIQSHTLLRGSD